MNLEVLIILQCNVMFLNRWMNMNWTPYYTCILDHNLFIANSASTYSCVSILGKCVIIQLLTVWHIWQCCSCRSSKRPGEQSQSESSTVSRNLWEWKQQVIHSIAMFLRNTNFSIVLPSRYLRIPNKWSFTRKISIAYKIWVFPAKTSKNPAKSWEVRTLFSLKNEIPEGIS